MFRFISFSVFFLIGYFIYRVQYFKNKEEQQKEKAFKR